MEDDSAGRSGAARVIARIAKFREEWLAAGRPNSTVEGFSFDDIDNQVRQSVILDQSDKATAIQFAETTLETMRLPEVADTEVDHNFLVVHWRMSRFQQLLFELLAESGVADERDRENIDRQRHEREISEISHKIDKISEEIKSIRSAKKFGGMSISILGISKPLDTIWKAIQRARKILSRKKIDSVGLTENLEAAYIGSKSVWEALSTTASSATEAVLSLAENIVSEVGEALSQVLGVRKNRKQSVLNTVVVQLNGNLSLSELTEIRNRFRENSSTIIEDKSGRRIESEIRKFEFGISIDKNRKDLLVADIVELNRGAMLVYPVYFASPENKRRSQNVAMLKRAVIEKVIGFFDAVLAGLQSATEVRLDIGDYEPVVSVVVNRRISDDVEYWG